MPLKFNLPDDSPQNKRRLVAASGGHSQGTTNGQQGPAFRSYANTGTFTHSITKSAQMMGSAANAIFTQPAFFSPLHTPQNWQIASKRREMYQWSFVSPCNLILYDGSIKDIKTIYEDVYGNIEGVFDIEGMVVVQDGFGDMRSPNKISKRKVHKIINTIDSTGLPEPLVVTHDHKCRVIKKEDIRCKYHRSKNCISGVCSPTCERNNCSKFKDVDYKVSELNAEDIEVGDYVLIPFPTEIKNGIIDTVSKARFAGHLAADGSVSESSKSVRVCAADNEINFVMDSVDDVFSSFGSSCNLLAVSTIKEKRTSIAAAYEFASRVVVGKGSEKKFTEEVFYLDPQLQKHVIGAYIQSDGCYNKQNDVYEITTYSPHLSNQLLLMCFRCGILARSNKQPISKSNKTFRTDNKFRYILNIPSSECDKISAYVPGKSKNVRPRKAGSHFRFFWKNNVVSRVRKNESSLEDIFVYDLRLPPSYTLTANNISVFQCRFFYENEPKVAAAVDFYAGFPMNGFKLECHDSKIRTFFEEFCKDIEMNKWLKSISHEYFLLGDVYPFLEINCPECHGSGFMSDGSPCNHPGGKFRRIVILNPDFIDVQQSVLAGEPVITLTPDEELRSLVQKKRPKAIYDRIPSKIIELIALGRPIVLANHSVSHIKHNASSYTIYGTSMLRRLFTVLAYKTKLLTANWLVAERLILPVRVVKIGDKDRPATADDIADVQSQLAAVANDPNLTIVTHHAFEYEWYGACYDKDTHVLTNKGIMNYTDIIYEDVNGKKQIKPEYEILVHDPHTGQSRYEKPLGFHEYNYDGFLVGFEGNKLDMAVTPNHTMLGFSRNRDSHFTLEARDFAKINECDRYVTAIAEYLSTESLEHVDVAGYQVPIDEFMSFAGYYVSEGHTEYKEDKRRYIVSIAQCPIKNSDYCDDIDITMDASGFEFHKYEYEGRVTTWNILKKDVAKQIKDWFGENSFTKRVPNFIKNLSVDKLRIFIRAFCNGDGAYQEHKNTEYVQIGTNSEQLANDLLEIMFKAGYSPTKSRFKKEDKQYVINCSLSESGKGRFSRVKDSHIKPLRYKGKVWCFETSTGFFVTERNGRIAIQGNTGKIHNISAEMEQIGKEILDGVMLNQAILNGEMAGYSCHDERTEVLTDSGFKFFKDLIYEEDEVCVFDKNTDICKYEQPHDIFEFDFSGEMVSINGKRLDICVTNNHKMLTRWDKQEWRDVFAENLKYGMRTRSVCDFVQGKIKYPVIEGDNDLEIDLGSRIVDLKIFLKVLGYYISEGCSAKNRIHIYQSSKKEKVFNSIKSSLNEFGYKFTERKYREPDSYVFDLHNKDLVEFLNNNFGKGAKRKYLPNWIKSLPSEYLQILIKSMLEGDGHKRSSSTESYLYTTSSKELADDFQHIVFSCGYASRLYWDEKKKQGGFSKENGIWRIHISKGRLSNGSFPIIRKHNLSKQKYDGKVYCVSTSTGYFVTRRNGKITIQGNSAQVGVEILLRRLESWRNELSDWIEEYVFKPLAQMQGFIDEEKTKELGHTVWRYPTIKWNDMKLRDNTARVQILLQAQDKGLVSGRTICEELDLDYDYEIEEIRQESVNVAPGGAMGGPGAGGGGMGGMGGMPPMGGGGAGAGANPGTMGMGDMVPGAPGGAPGAPGGMGGAPGGMGGALGGAPMAASGGMRIDKKGKGKSFSEKQQPLVMEQKRLTKLESRLLRTIQQIDTPHTAFFQYQIKLPTEQQAFSLDFAYPKIGVGVEADGKMWHERPDLKERDNIRDQKLSRVGWRILRFKEDAINEQANVVRDIIQQNILEASKNYKKKAEQDEEMVKFASVNDFLVAHVGDREYFEFTKTEMTGDIGWVFDIYY